MADLTVKEIFAKNVFRLRKESGLTQQQLGDHIGLAKTTICQWESAQKLPSAASINKIVAFFKVTNSLLFNEDNDKYISSDAAIDLPIVGKISRGNGSFTYENVKEYASTSEAWVRGGEYFYFRAEDDSMMYARILDGDLVLIRRQDDVENGDIGVVIMNDKLYLRRIYRDGNILSLHSENTQYPRISVIDDDVVYIVGKLKKIIIDA